MKRSLSLLLALTLPFTVLFTACGRSDPAPDDTLDELLQSAQGDSMQAVLGDIRDLRKAYVDSSGITAEDEKSVQALMQVTSAEQIEVPLYFYYSTAESMIDIVLFNDNPSVAYFEVGDLFDLVKTLRASDPGFSLEGAYGDKCYLAMRESGNYALIDFTNGTVLFSDYDSFGQSASAVSGGDILATPVWQATEDGSIAVDENGQQLVNLFGRLDTSKNFTRHNYPLALPLALNNIPIYWVDGKGYLPVTTFFDLFLSGAGYSCIFNGESLFLSGKTGFDTTTADEDGKTMQDLVYEGAKTRTKELAEYTYWELVLLLGSNYGLRDEHQIGDDFDAYFASIGLKDRLLSQDGAEFSEALSELMMGYFGDLHSGVNQASPYAGADYTLDIWSGDNLAASIPTYLKNQLRFATARTFSTSVDEIGNLIPYLELGDTAYVSFDSFWMDSAKDYYDPDVQEALPDTIDTDTIALIHYANEQIQRPGSPIKNVVLDISLNGGGMADSAIYVISWVLGSCPFSTVSPISNTQYTVGYTADVNLDGYLTEEDALDLNEVKVYCLTSGSSFSCGNLVPAVFKESGAVTLLGQKSGGGACVVEQTIAADGTLYQYSGHSRLSTVRNGSYYGIDQGVEPDFIISDPAHLYNRTWLTAYLAQLP